jgi:hypothetical protein
MYLLFTWNSDFSGYPIIYWGTLYTLINTHLPFSSFSPPFHFFLNLIYTYLAHLSNEWALRSSFHCLILRNLTTQETEDKNKGKRNSGKMIIVMIEGRKDQLKTHLVHLVTIFHIKQKTKLMINSPMCWCSLPLFMGVNAPLL